MGPSRAPERGFVAEPTFSLTGEDADVVFHALRYFAADLLESFLEDDESPALDEARHANELAGRLQEWIVAHHQSLTRDTAR